MNKHEEKSLSVIGRGLEDILRRRALEQMKPISVCVRPLNGGAIVKTYK